MTKGKVIFLLFQMKYLIKVNFFLLLFCPLASLAQTIDEVNPKSSLDCIQGVWQPINTNNKDLIEYTIHQSFRSLTVSYTKSGKLESVMLTVNGFYDFNNASSQRDSLGISELQEDGSHFVWFFEEDVKPNGWAQIGGIQKDFICEGDIIEMTDNAMTIFEKQPYLPFAAYCFLKERGTKDKRDYITEFDISSLLEQAEVTSEKSFFHDTPNEATKRRDFVVKGDKVIIDKITKDWVKAAYEGETTTTFGWLKVSDLKILE